MKKKEEIRKIEEELNSLYNFISGEENQGFSFSLSQSYERIAELEVRLKRLKKSQIAPFIY